MFKEKFLIYQGPGEKPGETTSENKTDKKSNILDSSKQSRAEIDLGLNKAETEINDSPINTDDGMQLEYISEENKAEKIAELEKSDVTKQNQEKEENFKNTIDSAASQFIKAKLDSSYSYEIRPKRKEIPKFSIDLNNGEYLFFKPSLNKEQANILTNALKKKGIDVTPNIPADKSREEKLKAERVANLLP